MPTGRRWVPEVNDSMASATARQTPPLLPFPAEFQFGAEAEAITLDAGIAIEIGPDASAQTLFAARQVQAAVQHATGLTLALRKAASPGGGGRSSGGRRL